MQVVQYQLVKNNERSKLLQAISLRLESLA